ncbi:MAG TPA: endonuclease, partial [Gammaproteobacteria bacterium]|nr:endonuclease [Gammaproteobacteria bacterium]
NIKTRRLKNLCHWLKEQGGLEQLQRQDTAELRKSLLSVNGIGPETADDILLYAFDRPVFVIDAYTRRLFTRLGCIHGNEHYETLQELFEQSLSADTALYNEYHALIVRHAKEPCAAKPGTGDCRHCIVERPLQD